MSVQVSARDVIVLEGHCSSEDAEQLLQRLLATPDARVDLRSCTGLHTAVIQVLLAGGPVLILSASDTETSQRFAAQLASVITS